MEKAAARGGWRTEERLQGTPHTTAAQRLVSLPGRAELNSPKYQSASDQTLNSYADIQIQHVLTLWLCFLTHSSRQWRRPSCVCGRVRGGVGVMVFDLL